MDFSEYEQAGRQASGVRVPHTTDPCVAGDALTGKLDPKKVAATSNVDHRVRRERFSDGTDLRVIDS